MSGSTTSDPLPAIAPVVASLRVDAGNAIGAMRRLQGVAGMPGPAPGYEQIPDLTAPWRAAAVDLVRSYDWVSRLDTVDDPRGLFPLWAADPDDPASYNFAATDAWVRQTLEVGAEVLFTIATSVPTNKRPAEDLVRYERVLENIVRHYVEGWGGGGFERAITRWEFGDQPDFGALHFDGAPEQFYAMYAAAARAVKRVDAALRFGGPCVAFALDAGPYRDGLLDHIREHGLPLDFLSWMWFTDDSRDPLDYRRIAEGLRTLLDARGFTSTELLLSYWNMTGIPNATFRDEDAAAFHAASAVYMQDSVIDRAILFRADTGVDLHYGILDPAHVFDEGGGRNARAASHEFVGRTVESGKRLAVRGGDENGFAILAGLDSSAEVVRVLVAQYAIPEAYLSERERDVLEFQVPVGETREMMSFTVLPRRVDARSAGVTYYELDVVDLPWGEGPHRVLRYRAGAGSFGNVIESHEGTGSTASIAGPLPASSVELIEISRITR